MGPNNLLGHHKYTKKYIFFFFVVGKKRVVFDMWQCADVYMNFIVLSCLIETIIWKQYYITLLR